jgi:hypothetical protein
MAGRRVDIEKTRRMAAVKDFLVVNYGAGWEAKIDPSRLDMMSGIPNQDCGCLVAQLHDHWSEKVYERDDVAEDVKMGSCQYDASWKRYIRDWQRRAAR